MEPSQSSWLQGRLVLVLLKSALMGASFGLCLLAAEIALHYFRNFRGDPVEVIDGRLVDSRDTYRVLYDFMVEGLEAYPAIYASIMAHFWDPLNAKGDLLPLAGVAHATTAFGNESKRYIVYESDRYGFNNVDALWDQQPQLFLVGDSFTQGAIVAQEESFSAHLSRKREPAISVGMSGNGPLIEFASLVEYVKPFAPRMVLWFYYEGNDLDDLKRFKTHQTLNAYLEDHYTQDLIHRQAEIDTQIKTYIRSTAEYQSALNASKTGSAFSSIVRLRSTRALVHDVLKGFKVPENVETREHEGGVSVEVSSAEEVVLLKRILESARDEVRAWGGVVVFVYIPEGKRYVQGAVAAQLSREAVLNSVQEMAIPVVDLHAYLSAQADPVSFYTQGGNGHFTAACYQALADYLITRLPQQEPLRQ